MKNNIKKWINEHEDFCNLTAVVLGVFATAFGGAYLGSQMSNDNNLITINLVGNDAIKEFTNE